MSKDTDTATGCDQALPVIVGITASAARAASFEVLLGWCRRSRMPRSWSCSSMSKSWTGGASRRRRGGHEPALIGDGMAIEPGRLYLNQPDMIVTIEDGRFRAHQNAQATGLQG